MRRSYFNLMEMLVVIAILMIIFELAFQFFYDGSRLCRNSIEKAFSNQELQLLGGKFRNFIHGSQDWRQENGCLVSDWKIEGNDLVAVTKKVYVEGSKLVFERDFGRTEIRLGENMQVNLRIEKTVFSANLAVLSLESMGKREATDRTRIVACF